LQVADYHGAMYSFVQIALREAVASRTIDNVLERREEIGPEIVQRCSDDIRSIGLEVISIDVRDLMFPGPLKKTFAQVIEARQQGLAALEKARGETAALRSLANAARMVESNPALLQLRLVQQLESSRGHTVVLGFPSSSTPLPVKREGEVAPKIEPGDGTQTSRED
jgi:regulator of protease activity HflC (stomatin/prohibitin superfamily)